MPRPPHSLSRVLRPSRMEKNVTKDLQTITSVTLSRPLSLRLLSLLSHSIHRFLFLPVPRNPLWFGVAPSLLVLLSEPKVRTGVV